MKEITAEGSFEEFEMRPVDCTVFTTPRKTHKLKVMLSYGMSERTDEEMEEARKRCIASFEEWFTNSHERVLAVSQYEVTFVDSLGCTPPPDGLKNVLLWYLGHAIVGMADIDMMCLDPEYIKHPYLLPRGCAVEYFVASSYGIPICTGLSVDHHNLIACIRDTLQRHMGANPHDMRKAFRDFNNC